MNNLIHGLKSIGYQATAKVRIINLVVLTIGFTALIQLNSCSNGKSYSEMETEVNDELVVFEQVEKKVKTENDSINAMEETILQQKTLDILTEKGTAIIAQNAVAMQLYTSLQDEYETIRNRHNICSFQLSTQVWQARQWHKEARKLTRTPAEMAAQWKERKVKLTELEKQAQALSVEKDKWLEKYISALVQLKKDFRV